MKKSLRVMLSLCLTMTAVFNGCKESELTKLTSKHLKDTKDLKNTNISSHMESDIENGKNLVYCSTFQLAWNELKDNIIKGDIKLKDEPGIVPYLNKSISTKKDLSDKDYVAIVGYGKDNILDRINNELKKKFGADAPKVQERLNGDDILAYGYLYKNLKFKNQFEKLPEPMKFKAKNGVINVNGFGIATTNNNSKRYDIAKQVAVIDYKNDEDFIVKLSSESVKDDIILAEVAPNKTLLNTIETVSQRIKSGKEETFGERDILKIPSLDFYINHSYDEFINKYFINQGFQDYSITKAMQDIRFKLDEKGAQLKSEANLMGAKSSIAIGIEKPKNLVFDKPYLLMLKEKGASHPYFAMWIENPVELTSN